MPYLGLSPTTGENNNFRILDDITSYTLTFDGSSSSVISNSDETITENEHRFVQGQRVTYTNGGGANIGGLTTGSVYYIIRDDKNTIKLAETSTKAAALDAINLTVAASGSSHTLTVAFDGTNTKFKATYNNGTLAEFTRAAQLQLSVNGVIQQPVDSTSPSNGFGWEHPSVIIFSTAPASTDAFWGHLYANNNPTYDIADNKVDTFVGTGSTTDFTLSKNAVNNENLLVTIDGVLQYPTIGSTTRAYKAVDNVLQFTAAPGSGVSIQVRHIGFAGAAAGGSGGVTGFYGRTGNVSLLNTDDITVNDAAITGDATITGDLTVNGTTTTLDTKLTEVDQILVGANNSTVAVAVTQSGAGDLLRLDDGSTRAVTVFSGIGTVSQADEGGQVSIGSTFMWRTDTVAQVYGKSPDLSLSRFNDQFMVAGSETNGAVNTGAGIQFFGHDGVSERGMAYIRGLKENGTSGNRASYLSFATRQNGGTLEERVRITGIGSVGIGTVDPPTKLNVNSTTGTRIRSSYTNTSGARDAGFDIWADDSGSFAARASLVHAGNAGLTSLYAQNQFVLKSDQSDPTIFCKRDGKVGVNTTGPSQQLTSYAESGYSILANGLGSGIGLGSNGVIVFGTKDLGSYATGKFDATEYEFKISTTAKVFINGDGDLTIGASAGNLGKVYIKQSADTDTEGLTLLNAGGSNSFRLFLGDSSGAVAHLGHGGLKQLNITQAGKVGIAVTNPSAHLQINGTTTSHLFVNAATHDSSTANEAKISLGYSHSGSPAAVGYIKLNETSTNSFDGSLTLGQPYNNGSGGSSTRDALKIHQDGGTEFTRRTVGGTESIGNVNNHWWSIGKWEGTTVDNAARAKLTILGANTHNSSNPAGGESIIYLSVTNDVMYARYYSITDHHEGINGVATKYDATGNSCEVWVRYVNGYSSNCVFADVTSGYFVGINSTTSSTTTPSGATLGSSVYDLRTSNGTNSQLALRIDATGNWYGHTTSTYPATSSNTHGGFFLERGGSNSGSTLFVARQNNVPLYVGRNDNGAYINIQKSGVKEGSINLRGDDRLALATSAKEILEVNNTGIRLGIHTTTTVKIGEDSNSTKLFTIREVTNREGVYYNQLIGGTTHLSGRAYGIGFDPEGYSERVKAGIVVEGDSGGWSHGKLHVLMNNSDNGDEATLSDHKVTVLPSGNIGIHTNNPGSLVEIYNPSTSGNTVLHVHNDKTGDAAQICLEGGRTSTNDYGQVLFKNRGYNNAIIQANGSADDGTLLFKTSAIGSGQALSTYLQIAANGNIKLGQNSQNAPGARLHVEDNNGTDYDPDATTGAVSEYFVNAGTGDCTGILLQNTSTNATNTCQATIHSVAEGTTKATALTFGTRDYGSTATGAIRERLRITSNGTMVMGTGIDRPVLPSTPSNHNMVYVMHEGSDHSSQSQAQSIWHESIVRGDSGEFSNVELFSFDGSYNCGVMVTVECWFHSIYNKGGYQVASLRAHRHSGNGYTTHTHQEQISAGQTGTQYITVSWGSSGSGSGEILTARVSSTNGSNYGRYHIRTTIVAHDGIDSLTVLR